MHTMEGMMPLTLITSQRALCSVGDFIGFRHAFQEREKKSFFIKFGPAPVSKRLAKAIELLKKYSRKYDK